METMGRVYQKYLTEFLHKKIVIITGPRQSGKTTLSKMVCRSFDYLNFDSDADRQRLREKSWDRQKQAIIFDEIHKMPKWKQWLKGIYDLEGTRPNILVTGSASLETYKKVGDSLAGRYFTYHLHPFDLRELVQLNPKIDRMDAINRLMNYGGFPEPYLEGNKKFYNLWKKTHLDIILRQDLIFQEDIRNIKQLELLIDLLKMRVGSPISYSNLALDLQVSDKTVKCWLQLLEDMYVIFKLVPYSKNIARANLKQPKYYFYDTGQVHAVEGNQGVKFENLVACSLLKEVQFRQDCLGEDWSLAYLSKRGGIELDFAIIKDGKIAYVIEVKTSENTPAKNFNFFGHDLAGIPKIQLVKELGQEKSYPNGIEIRRAVDWLCAWK